MLLDHVERLYQCSDQKHMDGSPQCDERDVVWADDPGQNNSSGSCDACVFFFFSIESAFLQQCFAFFRQMFMEFCLFFFSRRGFFCGKIPKNLKMTKSVEALRNRFSFFFSRFSDFIEASRGNKKREKNCHCSN